MTDLVKITSPPQQRSLLLNREPETAKLKAVSSQQERDPLHHQANHQGKQRYAGYAINHFAKLRTNHKGMSQQSNYKNIQLDKKQDWIIIRKSIFEDVDIFIKQGH